MKNLSKIILTALISFSGFLIFAGTVFAEDKIDVEYPVGTNINGDHIFSSDNIYPGWETSKTIRVRNASTTDDTNLYFTFKINSGSNLAGKLKLYVVRVADNNYRVGGAGDHWTLDSADGKDLYVDKLNATESEQYKIKIKFDENAGNEYQDLKTKFDIDFMIESVNAGNGTAGQILAAQGRTVTGAPPEVLGAETTNPVTEATGEVAGAESCKSIAWYVFALMLLVYAGLINFHLWYHLALQVSPRWVLEVVLTVAALAGWFYLDSCRNNRWFTYAVIIVGFVSYLIYLQFLQKALRMKNQ